MPGLKSVGKGGSGRATVADAVNPIDFIPDFIPFKDRKPVATDLRSIYTAASEEAALSALEAFSAKGIAVSP